MREKIVKDTNHHFSKKPLGKSLKNPKEGGGVYYIIKNGAIFDSVGINFSEVSGKFSKKFRSQILGASKNPNYWASGISVVAHMKNPKIPAMHFNTRYIVTSKNWFGGGMDATPSMKDVEEKNSSIKKLNLHVISIIKNIIQNIKNGVMSISIYPTEKKVVELGGYFLIIKKMIGKKDFSFVRNIGLCFLDCAKSIIERKMNTRWSKKQKNEQLYKRGRYIEFNLLYDKGTKFGLNTGGNVEAILMSLPPSAKWK